MAVCAPCGEPAFAKHYDMSRRVWVYEHHGERDFVTFKMEMAQDSVRPHQLFGPIYRWALERWQQLYPELRE